MTHASHNESDATCNELADAIERKVNRRDVLMGAAAGSGLLLAGGLLGCGRRGESVVSGGAAPELAYRFPESFLWGAGTSGLQHEGSPLADGAGPSSMYRWAHASKVKTATPSWFTPPNESFDVSADFYRRFRSDIQLMRELNLRAYNFEVYWPRILPEGTGKVNQAGLDFYDALVDEFLKADIVPLCNLYVFDHPAALQERGGWLNRDMSQWFADYASILFERLGDRVKYWTTICEIPIVHAYISGVIAPAPKQDSAELRAIHHLLLGQGRAVQAFRASGAKGQIGNQHLLTLAKPASSNEADVAAAQAANAHTNLLLLDSQMRGEYPKDLVEGYAAQWPADAIKEGDLGVISAPIDFFGMDYYGGQTVTAAASGGAEPQSVDEPGTAEGMREALLWVRERYGNIPIMILEIGEAVEDTVKDGQVDDPARLEYLRKLLTGAHRAIAEGVDVRGCFVWSFLDGWEFGFGLSRRYGLVHVDHETQQRIIKASGRWYGDMIRANGFDMPRAAAPGKS